MITTVYSSIKIKKIIKQAQIYAHKRKANTDDVSIWHNENLMFFHHISVMNTHSPHKTKRV